MKRLPSFLAVIAVVAALPAAALAQGKGAPEDVAAIQACLKENTGQAEREKTCVGLIAGPCLEEAKDKSPAAAVACHVREHLAWDDLLLGTFEQLRRKLEPSQAVKLREQQRVWTETRKQTCDFYWEFFRGPLAGPHAEGCYRRETAERVLYLLFFIDQTGRR